MNKQFKIILIMLILSFNNTAYLPAAELIYNNYGGDRLWSNPANWLDWVSGTHYIPTSSDSADIGFNTGATTCPIIDANISASIGTLAIGTSNYMASPQDMLIMTGGSLSTGTVPGSQGWIILGYGADNNGIFNLSGGTVTVGSISSVNDGLYVGLSGTGSLNVSGGKIDAKYLSFGVTSTQSILSGGEIDCTKLFMKPGSALKITGSGRLIIKGIDAREDNYITGCYGMKHLIAVNWLHIDIGQKLQVVYDGINTIVTAIANPSGHIWNSGAGGPLMTRDSLVYCLNKPRYATSARYCSVDSAGNVMGCASIISMTGQQYKYAAVYHTSYAAGTGYRFKVNLAGSNDLMNWTYVRTLIDNADMPKIAQVSNGSWVVLTHEQWMQQGPNGESRVPSQLGFKLFYDYNDLMSGTIRATWNAPLHNSLTTNINGTPGFYDLRMTRYNGLWGVDANVGFHFYNNSLIPWATDKRDLNGYGTITKLFTSSQSWTHSTAAAYNNLFINAGVTGNIGQRDTVAIIGGRFNIQEGNIGQPTTDWDKWRMWLYTFGDSVSYPTGSCLQYGACRPAIGFECGAA